MSTQNPDSNVQGRFTKPLPAVHDDPPPSHAALDLILNSLRDIYHLDSGVIYFPDYVNRELVCLAFGGYDALSGSRSPPRYRFDEQSMAGKVFFEQKGYFSPDPWNDPFVSPRGLKLLDIQTPLVGIPLLFEDRNLGVLVAWSQRSPSAKPEHLETLKPFGRLGAAYLAMSVVDTKRTAVLQQLWFTLTDSHIELSEEAALKMIMDALRAFPFDRVRLYEFKKHLRIFVPLDSSGMSDPQSLLDARISADQNPYAKDTLVTFLTNPKSRVYDRSRFGDDPDAKTLQKSNDLPWAVAPLVLNGELIGQIVVDNANTKHAIGADALHYLDAMSALAVYAIANKRSIQFLSLNSLPTLYKWLAVDAHREIIIKRLLIYLTCGDALGFTRAIFLEWHESPGRLVYRSSIGSLTSESFRRVAVAASRRSLDEILRDAPDIYDYELDDALKDFQIIISSKELPKRLLAEVQKAKLTLPQGENKQSDLGWSSDLARRIGEGETVTVPLQADSRVRGLIIVDRRWQPQPVREVDIMALRTFAHLAAQVLEQNELQQRHARQRSDQEWENMSYYAAHECRDPVNGIEILLRPLTRAVEKKATSTGLKKIKAIREHVEQLKTFIADFLSLAQAANINPIPIRLEPILQAVCADLDLIKMGIGVRINCPLDLYVLGDRQRLLTCFKEIVTNSMHWFDKEKKFMCIEVNTPNVSMVPLGLDASLRYAVIHFEDNGCGISQEDADRIFDPKFTKRRDHGGTGIGLYMVKRIVEGHNGMISQYGRLGLGNIIAIFLPLPSGATDPDRGTFSNGQAV